MKRRNVLLGGAAVISSPAIGKFCLAAQAAGAADPNRLNQDLTPLGGERAASASGLVPAWTGGVTEPPAGWSPGMLPPDLFGDEKPLFKVTAANVAQYANLLCDGQKEMLKRYGSAGFRFDVYPTHRTAAAPQYVYDNTFKNVTRAQPVAGGLVQGFDGAINGVPFPILSDDPSVAGAQAMWNHLLRWGGQFANMTFCAMVIGNNQRVLTDAWDFNIRYEYYNPNMTRETLGDVFANYYLSYVAPPNTAGGKFVTNFSLRSDRTPSSAYEYLVGEGRIREAPQTQYDIPATQYADAINYDESYLFTGPINRYTWKVVGKKELIVPYNQSALFRGQQEDVLGYQFINPDLVRNEVHRCWVIEAQLAPGARMTEPVRRFYLDEDTWAAMMAESYDDQGNLWKYGENFNEVHPDLPGTTVICALVYNFQSAEYAYGGVFYNAPAPLGGGINFKPQPASLFDPQSMADSGGL